jgi:hypothetical protein
MSKLLITEISRMGPAFCIIGLQHDNDRIQSIRPVPSFSNGWPHFPHHRGDILECSLTAFPGAKPHVEDRVSDLFGCPIHENKKDSGLYANPHEAQRSMCGCETKNLRLELCANELRATLALPSGEVLRDLPVVDRDWRDFVDAALAEGRGANRTARLERFLNFHFHYKIMSCLHHFIRLGLTRPFHDLCWLMLDTLFPLPRREWLEEF